MGLDMYLYASAYIWSHTIGEERDKKIRKTIKELFPKVDLEPKSIKFEAMYWRKANMIHKWFVDNVQNGEDDCGTYYVEREKLEELYNLICEALEHRNDENHDENADKLLPTTSGFFFGGTEYDDYYWEELERTKKELRALLDNKALEMFDFEYTSSW